MNGCGLGRNFIFVLEELFKKILYTLLHSSIIYERNIFKLQKPNHLILAWGEIFAQLMFRPWGDLFDQLPLLCQNINQFTSYCSCTFLSLCEKFFDVLFKSGSQWAVLVTIYFSVLKQGGISCLNFLYVQACG